MKSLCYIIFVFYITLFVNAEIFCTPGRWYQVPDLEMNWPSPENTDATVVSHQPLLGVNLNSDHSLDFIYMQEHDPVKEVYWLDTVALKSYPIFSLADSELMLGFAGDPLAPKLIYLTADKQFKALVPDPTDPNAYWNPQSVQLSGVNYAPVEIVLDWAVGELITGSSALQMAILYLSLGQTRMRVLALDISLEVWDVQVDCSTVWAVKKKSFVGLVAGHAPEVLICVREATATATFRLLAYNSFSVTFEIFQDYLVFTDVDETLNFYESKLFVNSTGKQTIVSTFVDGDRSYHLWQTDFSGWRRQFMTFLASDNVRAFGAYGAVNISESNGEELFVLNGLGLHIFEADVNGHFNDLPLSISSVLDEVSLRSVYMDPVELPGRRNLLLAGVSPDDKLMIFEYICNENWEITRPAVASSTSSGAADTTASASMGASTKTITSSTSSFSNADTTTSSVDAIDAKTTSTDAGDQSMTNTSPDLLIYVLAGASALVCLLCTCVFVGACMCLSNRRRAPPALHHAGSSPSSIDLHEMGHVRGGGGGGGGSGTRSAHRPRSRAATRSRANSRTHRRSRSNSRVNQVQTQTVPASYDKLPDYAAISVNYSTTNALKVRVSDLPSISRTGSNDTPIYATSSQIRERISTTHAPVYTKPAPCGDVVYGAVGMSDTKKNEYGTLVPPADYEALPEGAFLQNEYEALPPGTQKLFNENDNLVDTRFLPAYSEQLEGVHIGATPNTDTTNLLLRQNMLLILHRCIQIIQRFK